MKFLITGSVRSNRGPRLILTLALFSFLFFLFLHFVREAGSTGFLPTSVQNNLYAGPDTNLALNAQAPPGFLMVLEDLHIDLFLFALLALFVGSLLYQARAAESIKRLLIYLIFALPLAFIAARALAFFYEWAAYLVLPAAAGTYLCTVGTIVFVLWDLYRTRPA